MKNQNSCYGMKFIFFLVVTFIMNSNINSQNSTYIGVDLGVSINDLTEEFDWRNYICRHGCDVISVSPQSGRYYGISLRKDMSNALAIRVGLAYERFGFEEIIESTELVPLLDDQIFKAGKPIQTGLNTFTSEFETSYSALSVPVGARYYAIGQSSPSKFYIDGGLVYHYKLQESFTPYEQDSNTLYNHNFSASAGIGYEKRWGNNSITFGPSYSYSVTNWNDDEAFQRDEKFRPIQFRLNLGYAYLIK